MDILDIADIGEERAGALIMKAREIWFEDENAEDSSSEESGSEASAGSGN
jgi:hypothetical protein